MGCWMWKRLTGIVGLALLLTFATGIVRADAWWDKKWQYRRKVSFDTTDKGANIPGNLTEVPVLVRLHAGNFSFDNAKDDGSDVRFVASDDKTPLKYHLEKYDRKQGIALFWVKDPQIAGNSAVDCVWMYYGNSSAQAAEDSGGTYDTAQVAVFHLAEKEGSPKDSTSYNNHAAAFSGSLGNPSLIGNGVKLKGSGEKIVVQRSPSLNFAKGFTFSAWVRIAGPQSDAHLFSWVNGVQSMVVGINGDQAYFHVATPGKQPIGTGGSASLALNAWHHVAAVAEPNKRMALYVDGREVSAVNLFTELPAPDSDIAIGGSLQGNNSLVGELDEVRVSNVVRPANWVAAAFAGQVQDGKLTKVLDEESGKGGEENLTIHLLRVIAHSVTLDGWLIIGLCTSMLILATFVFVRKMAVLQKIKRGNHTFLETFNDLHDPLDMELERDDMEDSSLFRIYRAGCTQIYAWVEKHGEGKEEIALTRSAMDIFRAALDRASSNETKKLNAWMMVLTLGISGGPFWGLLGTVWGVMNTFASLAEAGEANLSAIAPGVASALACTLFGLLVAIPSLFAYSFLINHMKNLNSDTRHFIEEFFLRVEGFHGEE
jgi:biopolymer transport protein ExbB